MLIKVHLGDLALSRILLALAGALTALWLGVLFVLSVYFFPIGIVGKLRSRVRVRS